MKSPIIAFMMAAVLMLSGGAVYAENHGKGKDHGQCHDKMMERLDLTDEQREKMDALHDKMQAMRPDRKEARPFMKEMQAIVHADSFDEKAAKELIAKQQKMQAAHKLEKMRLKHQMYNVLTDEQKAEWDKIKQEKPEKRKDKMKDRKKEK